MEELDYFNNFKGMLEITTQLGGSSKNLQFFGMLE